MDSKATKERSSPNLAVAAAVVGVAAVVAAEEASFDQGQKVSGLADVAVVAEAATDSILSTLAVNSEIEAAEPNSALAVEGDSYWFAKLRQADQLWGYIPGETTTTKEAVAAADWKATGNVEWSGPGEDRQSRKKRVRSYQNPAVDRSQLQPTDRGMAWSQHAVQGS